MRGAFFAAVIGCLLVFVFASGLLASVVGNDGAFSGRDQRLGSLRAETTLATFQQSAQADHQLAEIQNDVAQSNANLAQVTADMEAKDK